MSSSSDGGPGGRVLPYASLELERQTEEAILTASSSSSSSMINDGVGIGGRSSNAYASSPTMSVSHQQPKKEYIIKSAGKRLLSRVFSRKNNNNNTANTNNDIRIEEEEETEDEHELLSSSTTTKRTPARGSIWSPRRDSGTPVLKVKSRLMSHQLRDEEEEEEEEEMNTERGEDVITQFVGDEEHAMINTNNNRGAETSSSGVGNINVNGRNSANGSGDENATSMTMVATTKRNIFARFFGACFGGKDASSSFSNIDGNTKQQRNIREDAKAPLRKEEKAPTVAGCVPVPCLKPQFSNVVGEGFTLHTGAYFLPAPETYRDAKSGNATSKPCLVLDLDETLVHSSFRPVPNPDYIIPVEIDGKITDVYVLKRPWVDLFLVEMAEKYELVVFTASLAKYANPLMDKLDVHGVVQHRLFRDACYPFQGNYVKDLTCLGRDLRKTIIIDNSPYSYMFHPQNALPVSSFIDDPADDALFDMLPHLYELAESEDVTVTLYENEAYMPRDRFYPTRFDKPPRLDRLGNKI